MPADLMQQVVKSPNGASGLQPPPTSYASQISLRGHPLRQSTSSHSIADVDNNNSSSPFYNVDIADPVRVPPSAFTDTTTAYDPHSESSSPFDDYGASPRLGHQPSSTATGSFLQRATSTIQQHTSRASFHSPTKSLASFIPSRNAIESTASQPKIRAGAKALQNWFNGASGTVSLGVGSQAEDESDDDDDSYDSEDDYEEEGTMMGGIFNRGTSFTRSSNESERQDQGTPEPRAPSKPQSSSASSRFAWLLSTQKNAAVPDPVASPIYHNPSDELLNLTISQALFPHGPVDPLAPASFNDLLSTAESLISRYQTSYRQLSVSLVDAHAEQGAQEDELDEADTRIRHLKSQMDMMAARAADQDEQMRRLMEELMFEKKARQEEEAARKRHLALIRHEDEMKNPRRRNRISNSDVSVDSGFESEVETDGASLCSHKDCLSPTGTDLSSVAETTDRETTPKGKRAQPVQRRSVIDKVRDGTANREQNSWGCSNCEGGSQASVWGKLAKEREENSTLRRRVGDLEEAVEGALNVVIGPWGT